METHGRERRWRYFTFASYREIIANEKLDDQDGPYPSVDCFNVGNFAPFVAEDFYADVAELHRITDYAFSKTGKVEDVGEEAALKRVRKVATPTRGNKRKRGEAGPDVDADGEIGRTPRKRGRPRKDPVESQDGVTGAAGKVATLTSDNDHIRQSFGENTKATSTQQGATGTTNDPHSPSPGVLRKRTHPPDDSAVTEASKPTKRRGRSRKQPTSLPPIDETVDHPPPQHDSHPSHVHVARRPLPEPPPPNAEAEATETQSTPKGCDIADNQHNSTQPAITNTVSMQGRTETVEGDIAQMDKSSGPSVLLGHILGNASARPQDSRKVTGVQRADSVSGKMFLVVESRATRLTSEWP
jgi:hypothetical protein